MTKKITPKSENDVEYNNEDKIGMIMVKIIDEVYLIEMIKFFFLVVNKEIKNKLINK